jgi:hypothetical protein
MTEKTSTSSPAPAPPPPGACAEHDSWVVDESVSAHGATDSDLASETMKRQRALCRRGVGHGAGTAAQAAPAMVVSWPVLARG